MVGIVFQPPHIVISGFVVEVQRAQVVDISSLYVHHLAEKPLLRHIQRSHLEKVVAAVFQHHAVAARLLGRIDQLPALVDRHRGRNFQRHVFPVSHRVDGDRSVQQPRRAVVDQIDVLPFADLFPILRAGISGGGGQPGVFQRSLSILHQFRTHVAQRYDPHPVQVGITFHGHRAAHPESDKSHPNHRNRIAAQLQHVGLPFRAGRLGEFDHSVAHFRRLACRRLRDRSREQHRESDQ